ncbi:MAG: hypothetical protein COX07_05855 [Bacteroidetes bacterium CG23_combo_of_CG06-09_8_20_14_all_32_9]|nr:MAG: hypothetical protein COX07_05855 [Bacteroidetes bacterium CG23_combo_of_CG06-09_8_20_14_all_32_9]
MSENYICPKCNGLLNVGNNIIFAIRKKNNEYGIIFLSAKVNDYLVIKNPELILREGELYDFFCPMCHANLKTDTIHDNLAQVIKTNKKNEKQYIIFSRIYGEKCTFLIKDKIMKSFGEDAPRYLRYLNLASTK